MTSVTVPYDQRNLTHWAVIYPSEDLRECSENSRHWPLLWRPDHSTQPRPPLIAYHSLQKSLSLPTLEQQVNTCNPLWEKSLKQMFIDSDRVTGTLVFSKMCLFSLAMALKSLCNFVSICKMGVMIAQWQITICCICEVVKHTGS